MKLQHLPDGRSIGDTAVMVALTARPAGTIRRHCLREPGGYDVQACTETLEGAPDPILTTSVDASRYLGIPRGTIRSWASRGLLRPYDHDRHDRPLYDVGDLLKLRQGDQG